MSRVVGGSGMEVFVCIDGVVVLSGAVLTAYVGVVGLVNRLSMDRIFPEVFMWTNSCRGTKHWAILGFFALCASLFLILAAGSSNGEAQMNNLSGVYALVRAGGGGEASIMLSFRTPPRLCRPSCPSWRRLPSHALCSR